MPAPSPDRARSVAIEQLRALGLSTYAARTFVALVGLGEGTARDVSDVAEVPRTRVYDAVEELRGRGLVDVQQSTPKRFWAISTETTGRHFEQEYARRVNVLMDALDGLETAERSSEQRGVWTVTGRETVTERVTDFVGSATDEIVYMTVEDLLSEAVVEALHAASERGVSIRLAGMSQSVETTMDVGLPEAEPFESLWDWSDTPAGRLLMVDGERTLVSVLVPGNGDHPPEPRDETAIWGSGEANGLVVVLKRCSPGSSTRSTSDRSRRFDGRGTSRSRSLIRSCVPHELSGVRPAPPDSPLTGTVRDVEYDGLSCAVQ